MARVTRASQIKNLEHSIHLIATAKGHILVFNHMQPIMVSKGTFWTKHNPDKLELRWITLTPPSHHHHCLMYLPPCLSLHPATILCASCTYRHIPITPPCHHPWCLVYLPPSLHQPVLSPFLPITTPCHHPLSLVYLPSFPVTPPCHYPQHLVYLPSPPHHPILSSSSVPPVPTTMSPSPHLVTVLCDSCTYHHSPS